jgi:hypothetical protein
MVSRIALVGPGCGALLAAAALTAAVLGAVSLTSWSARDHAPPCQGVLRPPKVVPALGAIGGLVVPSAVHPDARPWPHGMVIGPADTSDRIALRTADTSDRIALRSAEALERRLAALLAPWLGPAI